MIAKLIVHGETRAIALHKLERALAGTQVAGSVTNLAFLRALARHQGFGRGEVDTGLIDREVEALAAAPEPCSRARSFAAVGALGLDGGLLEGFTLWAPVPQSVTLARGGHAETARVAVVAPGRYEVVLEDAGHEISRDTAGWRVDGAPVPAEVVRHGAGLSVFWGNNYHFDLPDPLDVAAEGGAAVGRIEAPMPGLVKAVFVAKGAAVQAGDRLAILEAMKMEHVLTAGRDGVVAEVLAEAGAQVEAGAALIVLEEEAAE